MNRTVAVSLSALSLFTGFIMLANAETAPSWLTPEHPEWPSYFAVDPVREKPTSLPDVSISDGTTVSTVFYGSVAGFNAGKIIVDATMGLDAYEMSYGLRQAGISSWFSEAQNDTLARGVYDHGAMKTLYYSVDEFEKDDDYRKVELYRFTPEERYKIWSEPAYNLDQPVTPASAARTVDPLSALALLGFKALPAGVEPCDRTVEIYDGKRRFNFVMEPAGYYEFRRDRQGRYKGPAWRCSVSHQRIAGYTANEMAEQSKSQGFVYLGVVPAEVRKNNLTYFPVLLEGRRGIIRAQLEPRNTVFSKADGTRIAW